MLAVHSALDDRFRAFADPSVCSECTGEPTPIEALVDSGIVCSGCLGESSPCPDCATSLGVCPTCRGHGWTCASCRGGVVQSDRCRDHSIDDDAEFLLRTMTLLEAGVVPFSEAPGWADWPAPFVDALSLALAERAEIERAKRKRGD